ncbi:MAG: hypothetical protein L0Y74_11405 [candidate division Zixibacteria bacterium]|nr:hypothetical protein [candidate division Zixibacteria bacterium]
MNGRPAKYANGKIVLTVAHLGIPKADGVQGNPHDKLDCRDENLKAMCQRCHLRYDLPEHLQNRLANERAAKEGAGQKRLDLT